MPADRECRVLVASDGSASAKAAVATAVRFPWPARTLAQGVTARHVPADDRRPILLAALERSDYIIAAGARGAQRAVEFVGRMHPPRVGQVTLFTAVDHMAVPAHALLPSGVRATMAAEVRRINGERAARANKDLVRADATLTRAGWRVRTAVTAGAPLRELLATADSAGADLLVVGARGASGVRHLLLGSVAEGALNRCPVPVLVVR